MGIIFSFNALFLISAAGAAAVLAYLVYRNNSKSATNRIFVALSIIISIWLAANFISLDSVFSRDSLFWIRFSIFWAAMVNCLFFLLTHTIPGSKLILSAGKITFLLFSTLVVMGVALSPYAFTSVEVIDGVPRPVAGLGLAVFGAFSIAINILAVYFLARKIKKSASLEEKNQLRYVMFGVLAMFSLIIFTIFIPAAFWGISVFVSFLPLYTLIFLAYAAYAIVAHNLFDIKIVAAEALTLALWIALLARLMLSGTNQDLLFNGIILGLSVIFGVLLIRSVQREVEQRERLKDVDRLKTELMSFVSHQLKSPIGIIKQFASLILDKTYNKTSDIEATTHKIKNTADRLLNLVDSFLDLRKLEEGRMEYHFEKVDLISFARGIIEEMSILAKQKGLALSFESPSQSALVMLDAVEMRQVFQNLLDNSIKYTPSGFVKVTAVVEDKQAVISVSDSGQGIAPEALPNLFEQFYREYRTSGKFSGTGLGLYITKQIVEAHRGEIKAESLGVGEGSNFIVRLPLAL